MKRLELTRIRACNKCGRGSAELRDGDGERLVVPLDAVHARQLSGGAPTDDVRSLTDLVLEQLAVGGVEAREVVIDLADGRLRALVSFQHAEEHEVVACTAGEGVALALRGDLKLYATDEALSRGTAKPAKPASERGPDTVH